MVLGARDLREKLGRATWQVSWQMGFGDVADGFGEMGGVSR